jgi:hypothetical protein
VGGRGLLVGLVNNRTEIIDGLTIKYCHRIERAMRVW